MSKRDPLLTVKNLKTYFYTNEGVIPSVDGVSFQINKGEIVALVGESGCGKSVTSLSILGLIDSPGKIVDGSILFGDHDLIHLSNKEKRRLRGNEISMIFQEPLTALNPVFSVGHQIQEAILVHQAISKEKAKEKSIELLRRVGIADPKRVFKEFPHSLSGGMRQRVMIAMALSSNPKLMIADEPTTALDVTIQAQILGILKGITETLGTSILLITHDLGVVAEVADRVIVMYAGQIVEETDVFTLFQSPQHPYTKALLNSSPKMDLIHEKLEAIEGTVPSPLNMPYGCRFQPRCRFAVDDCKHIVPPLKGSNRHMIRCLLTDEVNEFEVKTCKKHLKAY
ncbi:ABC transporter ATP-binding protein [Metabacillus arenae]|uniref:ABC transporter ATP-binding protein n=1 Tax=Metabacillus arenae TaxID=2771434 RepID=A0A926NEF6_9BACI|nr:ABC transporter ATP-binding protein [Metabacillus arenae]MBD1378943.1 ABC transporter ATP-binding protein [Metabacillus arenae]